MWVAENLDALLGGDIMKILGFYAKRPIPLPKWNGMPEVATLDATKCKKLRPKFEAAKAKGKAEQKKALTELCAWLKAGEKSGLVVFIL